MTFRKAFWMLKGKPLQSFLYILLTVIIASVLLIGVIFKETGEFITSGGTFYYSVEVNPKDKNGGVSQDTIKRLAENPYVSGYNYNVTQEAEPENFKNWVEYNKNDSTAHADSVELSVNLNVEFADIFSNDTARLTEGSFPDENKHGVVIEKSMAEYNSIKTGDTLNIKTKDEDASAMSLKVIGIYQLKSPIEIEKAVGNQTAYVVSPYTRLYTNFDSIALGQNANEVPFIDFYTLKEKNIPLILNDFNSKIGGTMEARDSTNTMFVVLNRAVNSMNQYYDWIIYALILTCLVIFILFSVYAQHKNIYETAILSVLGESKKDILLHNTLCIFILSAISNLVFSVLALIFSNPVGLFWIFTATKDYTVEVCQFSFHNERTALINNFTVNNPGLKIIAIVFIIFFISIVISFLYSLSVLRLTPRKRMDRAN